MLTTVGLEGPVAAEGSLVPRMIMWSGKGKRLGEVRNGARDGVGAESVVIKRGVLNQILREEAKRQGIKIEFGKKLQGLEVTSEQEVIATFQDGTKAFGDLLVGSDGIHSRTRQLINPGAPKPTYTGLISTGGFTHSLTMPVLATWYIPFKKRINDGSFRSFFRHLFDEQLAKRFPA